MGATMAQYSPVCIQYADDGDWLRTVTCQRIPGVSTCNKLKRVAQLREGDTDEY